MWKKHNLRLLSNKKQKLMKNIEKHNTRKIASKISNCKKPKKN